MWQTSPFPESAEPESWVPSPKYLARGGVGLWLVTQPVESVECTQYTPWLKSYSQDIFDIFDLERVVLCCIKLSFCATINSGTRNLLQKYICTVYIIGHWHCMLAALYSAQLHWRVSPWLWAEYSDWAGWAGGASQVNMGQPTRAWLPSLQTTSNAWALGQHNTDLWASFSCERRM